MLDPSSHSLMSRQDVSIKHSTTRRLVVQTRQGRQDRVPSSSNEPRMRQVGRMTFSCIIAYTHQWCRRMIITIIPLHTSHLDTRDKIKYARPFAYLHGLTLAVVLRADGGSLPQAARSSPTTIPSHYLTVAQRVTSKLAR